MKGTYNKAKSQYNPGAPVYDLDNGVRIYCEDLKHGGGQIVTCMEGLGAIWHSCNGVQTLPAEFDFAREWFDTIMPSNPTIIIRPDFEKVYTK